MSYSHEWGVQHQTFFGPAPWGPGEGLKGQISFNFNYKVNFKDFYTKLCVCSHNKRYKTYQTGFALCRPGHAQGVVLWGVGVPRWVKKKFKHGHVAYQIDGDDEQNRLQVKFSSRVKLVTLGVRSKGQISLNLDYHVNSKIFYTNLCVRSYKKNIVNILNRILILLLGS